MSRLITADDLRALSDHDFARILEELGPAKVDELQHTWEFWARDNQLLPEGDWSDWLLLMGRGAGKLLCKDTPIFTPTGWKTVGSVEVGDTIFDENGKPTKVIKTFDDTPEKAYRLHFSDGTFIDCCDEHQWVTWTHKDRKSYLRYGNEKTAIPEDWVNWHLGKNPVNRVRTTKDIVDTFRHGKRGDLNHSIPLAKPIQLPEQNLLVDPYLFGYWLGDGSKRDSSITCHPRDQHNLVSHAESVGYEVSFFSHPNTIYIKGLFPKIRDMGGEDKKIPQEYYLGSVEQRLGILRGLMDSDGTVTRSSVEFSAKRKEHALFVLYLARSLGQKPVMKESRATLYGKDCGARFRVTWCPCGGINPFKLERKASKVVFGSNQSSRNHQRMIVDFEEIESKPMRCFTVDSPNSLFLVGEQMVPTHNTRTGSETTREWVKQGYNRIAMVGPTARSTIDVMVQGESGFINCCWENDHDYNGNFLGKPVYNPSKANVTFPQSKRQIIISLFSAEEPERLRGPQFAKAWCFIAGTLVETIEGPKKVESISTKDMVLTRGGYKSVSYTSERDCIVGTVTFSDGRTLTGTFDHPIMTSRGWVKLGELVEGNCVCAIDVLSLREESFTLSVVSTWQPKGQQRVYNIQVNETPEYFANGILTHNCDELASWRYLQETWDMLKFCLRLQDKPQTIITTTPKPLPLIKKIMRNPRTVVSTGSSYENQANLASDYIESLKAAYEGTRLGSQEIYAEILDEAKGALWTRDLIDRSRIEAADLPVMVRTVVAVDPAMTVNKDSDETGIMVVGRDINGHAYVLEDATGIYSPSEYAKKAVELFDKYDGDRIVYEGNQGGDAVKYTFTVEAPDVPLKKVWASKGKFARAEPCSALYEQNRVHHVRNDGISFDNLEEEMVTWEPTSGHASPNRLDALVWALTELCLGGRSRPELILDYSSEKDLEKDRKSELGVYYS